MLKSIRIFPMGSGREATSPVATEEMEEYRMELGAAQRSS
jgi:hypothetical protein